MKYALHQAGPAHPFVQTMSPQAVEFEATLAEMVAAHIDELNGKPNPGKKLGMVEYKEIFALVLQAVPGFLLNPSGSQPRRETPLYEAMSVDGVWHQVDEHLFNKLEYDRRVFYPAGFRIAAKR